MGIQHHHYSLESKEEGAGAGNEDDCQIEDARVGRRHQDTITEELVASRKHFPLPRHSRIRGHSEATADPIH